MNYYKRSLQQALAVVLAAAAVFLSLQHAAAVYSGGADNVLYLPLLLNNFCAGPIVDPFDEPGDWPTINTAIITAGVDNGVYDIRVTQRFDTAWVDAPFSLNSGDSMQVTLEAVAPTLGSVYARTAGGRVAFWIRPDIQRMFFVEYVGGQAVFVERFDDVAAIDPSGPNVLGLSRNGDELQFTVNGTQVDAHTQDDLNGTMGLGARSGTTDLAEAQFDDFFYAPKGCSLP